MAIARSRLLLAALALVAASALAVFWLAGASPAHAARKAAKPTTCDVSKVATRLGPTSVSSLKVLNVKCDVGISVVKAFHSCRLAHGKSGRCVRLVKGYACSEQRTNSPTQFTATATCKKGKASVTHRYTQVL